MRVLVVSNMYPRDYNRIGGIFVHEQVKALRAKGVDARVVSGGPHWLPARQPLNAARQVRWHLRHNRSPQWTEHEGVPVVYFPYFAGAFCRVAVYPQLYRWSLLRWIDEIRRDFPFDLVHAHTAFLDGTAGAGVAQRFGVPLILTEHTGPFTLLTRTLAMRLQTERAINAADHVLAVSSALRRDILKNVRVRRPDHLTVMPNGVDVSTFAPVSDPMSSLAMPGWPGDYMGAAEMADLLRQVRGIAFDTEGDPAAGLEALRHAILHTVGSGDASGEETPAEVPDEMRDDTLINALWVGHFVDVKRIDRLVHGFAIAHRRNPRLRLTLLGASADGGGVEHEIREQIRKEGLTEVVRILPGTGRDGVRHQMQRCDFLVISSETETFGVVAIEALSLGKPVLSTRCGGPEDIISSPELGLLVDKDGESIAIGMTEMARRIAGFDAEAIRRHTVETYGFDRISDRLIELYGRFVGHASGQGGVAAPAAAVCEAP